MNNLQNTYTSKKVSMFFLLLLSIFFAQYSILNAQNQWLEKDSEHFRVIYRPPQAFLVPHVITSAETALKTLMKLFDYKPSEKIVIALFDINDYGSASTTSVPENIIRLDVEPFEHEYENIPFNERFQWILSHELVHVVVDDHPSDIEAAARTLFSKVEPEKEQPLSVFYSLLTNFNRYTPRWHQEGIAVFLETWLSGGFGRVLGNFDEMFFRSMVLESVKFPSYVELDATTSQTNFLLGMLYYLYGARFCAYLSLKYGPNKLIDWFKEKPGDFYEGFIVKFKKVFGIDLDQAWDEFIQYEKFFQTQNIKRLESSRLTPILHLTNKPIGWITEPHFDPSDNSIIYGFDAPNHLAQIRKLYLSDLISDKLGTLPTPSLVKVASTAFDKTIKFFFYTTKNNELYRDIWVLNTENKKTRLLFPNCRIGDLTVSPETHNLWGVLHSDAETSLMVSPFPYKILVPLIKFNVGDELYDLSISPSGRYLAAVLHRDNGQQSIIIVNSDSLKNGSEFKYITVTDQGSPESPSWSPDGKYLYWNAYVNGVSNIYRQNLETSDTEPMSNVLTGLFKPVYISKDSLFAFEFTAKGFMPVLIPNKTAGHLYAIKYLGEKIAEKDPEVTKWALKPNPIKITDTTKVRNFHNYNSLGSLKILTFIPVITGFQDQKVFGFFTHISDPLIINDLSIEFGVAPTQFSNGLPRYHLRAKYEYKKKFSLGFNYNAPDFYDLFNDRKSGMVGMKYSLGYTNYWVYDNPLKVMQTTSIDYYSGIEFLNDNIVKVSQPDFGVAQTTINSKDLRRSIGSVDFEHGNEFNATLMGFGTQTPKLLAAGQIYGEWDNYSTWLWPHNIFHFKLASGIAVGTDNLVQAQFYFGGFGNRKVEDEKVDQYRKVFRFPGIPIYSLNADKFLKIMIENELPPLRFSDFSIGQHYISHASLSFYSQALAIKSPGLEKWVDAGAQINLVFKHWFNLESTLSAGIGRAWYSKDNTWNSFGNKWEWFLSYKLLRN